MKFELIDGKPHLCTSLNEVAKEIQYPDEEVLNEADYKEIQMFIDNEFLKQKVRADALEGVRFKGVEDSSLVFSVKSSIHKDNNIIYSNVINIVDWNVFIDDETYNPIDRARALMMQSDLKVHCTCPSFLFWGYQYLLTQIDAAVVPEDRPPNKRNPQQRGIICKHLNRTFRSYPFFVTDFASYIRRNHKVSRRRDKTQDKNSQMTQEAFLNNTDTVYEDILRWNSVKKQ